MNRNRVRPARRRQLVLVDDVEALTGLSGIQALSPNDILKGDRDLWTRQWFIADRDFLLNNTEAIRPFFLPEPDDPPDDPARFYDDQEDTYAAYLQTNFAFESVPCRSMACSACAYVQIDSELNGFQSANVGGGVGDRRP